MLIILTRAFDEIPHEESPLKQDSRGWFLITQVSGSVRVVLHETLFTVDLLLLTKSTESTFGLV